MIMISLGKISLKPDQNSRQTQRCLALLNPSLILRKDTQPRPVTFEI